MIENPECCSVEDGSSVVRKENGKVFGIKNTKRRRIQVCKVDGCLISGSSKKCDYLFVLDLDAPKRIVLVELKGIDHIAALYQLVSTAEQLDLKSKGLAIECYIVGSPNPKIQTKFQKELLRVSARYKQANLNFPQRKSDRLTIGHVDKWRSQRRIEVMSMKPRKLSAV
ncbi:MAG: hypothetical protein ACK4L4_16190, partial [Gemmobacter sp.]